MKVAISGASGYIGTHLCSTLKQNGHEVTTLSRHQIYGSPESLAACLSGSYAVINLAGAPILQRWNKHNRSVIYNSRINTTRNLTQAINLLSQADKPRVFVSASAVGIYQTGFQHDETSQKLATNFVGTVVNDWEQASGDLHYSVRRVIFRIGVVLGKDSQTIQKMVPLFKLGLGGKLGSGSQDFPFIYIQDLIRAFTQSLADETFSGIYNLVAPVQETNLSFTKQLAKKLKKPAFFTVPGFIMKLVYGQASSLILKGQRVLPSRLINAGFTFTCPDLETTLNNIFEDN